MTVVVDTPEDYAAWLAEQKTFGGDASKKEEATAEAPADTTKMTTGI